MTAIIIHYNNQMGHLIKKFKSKSKRNTKNKKKQNSEKCKNREKKTNDMNMRNRNESVKKANQTKQTNIHPRKVIMENRNEFG